MYEKTALSEVPVTQALEKIATLADGGHAEVKLSLRELKVLCTARINFIQAATQGQINPSQAAVRLLVEKVSEAIDDLERYVDAMVQLEGEQT